jgi:DDE_Tnp_1-associated
MAIPVSIPLLDHFAALSDPRQRGKVLYPLPEILLLVLSATIAGRTISSRRRCGEPSIWRSSDASTPTTAASRATIRCAMCSPRWTRSCLKPAFWPGSMAYATHQ